MSRTLVVEPNPGGHHFQAAASVARLARAAGEVVLLTSAGAEGTDEFGIHLAGLDLPVETTFTGPHPSTREFVAAITAACARHDIDTVVVMDGDVAVKQWWWRARLAFRSLRTRPTVKYFFTRYPARLELDDWRHWRLKIAKAVLVLLARLTGTLDRASGFAGRDERPGGWLVKRAIDPALCTAHARDRERLRKELGLPEDRRLVGIFGGINVRKNPRLVLDAVLRAGDDVDLVLAGPVDEETRAWIDGLPAEHRGRMVVADGFLPDELLDQYLASVEVVVLVMTLEGPSGIQGKALAAGVPVVSAGSRTRARELAATRSGIDTEPTVEAVSAGIRTLLEQYAGRVLEPTRLATSEEFAATILGPPFTAAVPVSAALPPA